MLDAHQDDHTGGSGHGKNKCHHPFAKFEGLLGKADDFTTPSLCCFWLQTHVRLLWHLHSVTYDIRICAAGSAVL